LTISFGALAHVLLVGNTALGLISPRISGGMDGVVEMLPASPAVIVLAAGLLLHLAGLFAPLRGR
jgi:hypothetical protein